MSSEPSSMNGHETATDTGCKCGAPAHAELPDRCAAGHVTKGNTAAMVTGERSSSFWLEHDRHYRELLDELAADIGHDSYEDAPAAARGAFDGLAQALILRDSAYRRTVENGGPVMPSGRPRRVAKFQQEMDRRAEAWCRQLGLKRIPKAGPSLAEYMEKREAEQ